MEKHKLTDAKRKMKKWIASHFPIVWMDDHQRILKERERVADEYYARKIKEIKKPADDIVSRLSKIDFRRCDDNYIISIRFDPRMMGRWGCADVHKYIAEVIGRQVEEEIATARFIQKANAHERI